jgi:hypothetical protein
MREESRLQGRNGVACRGRYAGGARAHRVVLILSDLLHSPIIPQNEETSHDCAGSATGWGHRVVRWANQRSG